MVEETKKPTPEVKTEVKVEESKAPGSEETPTKKKNTTKVILIIVGVLLLLGMLCGGGAYLFLRNASKNLEDELNKELSNIEERAVDEGTTTDESSADETEKPYPTIEDSLESTDLINGNFPEDIPLSGGKVESSSYKSSLSVDVVIRTSSSVEDIHTWYQDAITEAGWKITGQTRDENTSSISFDNGKERYKDDDYRRGGVDVYDYSSWGEYWNYVQITVKEYYY